MEKKQEIKNPPLSMTIPIALILMVVIWAIDTFITYKLLNATLLILHVDYAVTIVQSFALSVCVWWFHMLGYLPQVENTQKEMKNYLLRVLLLNPICAFLFYEMLMLLSGNL